MGNRELISFQSEVDRLSDRKVFFLKIISLELSPSRRAYSRSNTLRDNHFSLNSMALFRPLSIVKHSSSTYWKYIELEIKFSEHSSSERQIFMAMMALILKRSAQYLAWMLLPKFCWISKSSLPSKILDRKGEENLEKIF